MAILVTGGGGYIGSHMTRSLHEDPEAEVVVLDSLERGRAAAIPSGVPVIRDDLGSSERLVALLRRHAIESICHFAGYAIVSESVRCPERYFEANTARSANLILAARQAGVREFVFSSTAAVYGTSEELPIREDAPARPLSPYGLSKLMVEQLLDRWADGSDLRCVSLRYFNVAGAGYGTGEAHEPESHLIPCLLQAAARGERARVFGTDFPTPDGTCIRDYVHVVDLVHGHQAALRYLREGGASTAMNLGSGRPASVREVIAAVQEVTGRDLEVEDCPPRPGDPPILVADVAKAATALCWRPRLSLLDAVASAWDWIRSPTPVEPRARRCAPLAPL